MTLPNPNSFESTISLLTLAIAAAETHPPTTSQDLHRLRLCVGRLDQAAVRASQYVREEG